MEVNPKPHVVKELKRIAEKQGITLNALVVPYLNDIAAGLLTRRSCYVVPEKPQPKAA